MTATAAEFGSMLALLGPQSHASFPVAGSYGPPYWERGQVQEKWVDLIQTLKDVAARFADGGSR